MSTRARHLGWMLAAALAWAAAAGPASAQQAASHERALGATVERLEAENAVLRLELRALTARTDELEAMVRRLRSAVDVLTQQALGAGAGPAGPPALEQPTERPQLTEDGSTVILPDLELGPEVGAKSPEELARRLHHEIATLPQGGDDRATSVAAAIRTLSAFGHGGHHGLVVPAALWTGTAPEHLHGALPTRDELEAALTASAELLSGSRLTSMALVAGPAKGPIAVLDLRVAGSRGADDLRLTAVSVEGRWLVAHVRAASFEKLARDVLERIARLQPNSTDGPRTTFPELYANTGVGSIWLDGRPSSTMTSLDRDPRFSFPKPAILRIPLYTIDLRGLARGEYGAVATPDSPAYPTLLLGPLPGEHDPAKDPYVVRVRE